jgi:AcrR family transcriptional regulator
LDAAAAVALRDGLGGLTFAAVARRADVPDRTVVYYFPTKAVLVTAVVDRTVSQLMDRLGERLDGRRRSAQGLLAALWPVVTGPEVEPTIRIWLDLCLRAAAGEQPHLDAARTLAQAWLTWLADRVQARTDAQRDEAASAVLARLDGALLLRQIGLPDQADQSVR